MAIVNRPETAGRWCLRRPAYEVPFFLLAVMSVDRGRSEDSYDGGLKTAINERFFNEALDQLVVFNNEDNN